MGDTADARVALLSGLIDHAPLFPPASLPLPEALAEDARARESRSAFALGRLVWPASRLHELPDVDRRLSVVLDAPFEHDRRIEAVEMSFAKLDGIAPRGVVYVEIALDDGLERALERIADLGLRAKVRCGGASVPTSSELARFIRACRERRLAFKATAGLHHALRSDDGHGLLNLLAAVVFGDEETALDEQDPGAFVLERGSFGWRSRAAAATELAHARHERLHAVGSCSFFEPIAELEALGVLPL